MHLRNLYFVLIAVLIGSVALIAAMRLRPIQPAETAARSSQTYLVSYPKQLWHCGMHPQVIQDHPGECPICHMALTPIGSSDIAVEASGGPEVRIDPAVVQNMGVRTAVVTRGPLTKTVRTVGILKLPEPGMHDVSLKIGGWIDKLYADQDGMHVEQGEPLFQLYSPDLQVAEQELIVAAKAEKSLASDAAPELRREAHGMVESARRKLLLWDVAGQDVDAIAKSDQPPRDVPFRSPATGHIENKSIVQGSAVQPMAMLLRVADHTKMWLDAEIYSDQMPFVKQGQEVIATVDGLPGKTWKGKISFVYPHIDHMTRTLTVRVTLENPDFALRPGMYATADIVTQPVADAILVPREAVIDTGMRRIAFVTQGGGQFSPRVVRTALTGDDDRVQVIEGLAPGETVVTSGEFLMDVESRTIEATQKLTETSALQPAIAEAPMPSSAGGTLPSTQGAATRPAELPAQLNVAYCPMAKARWLQTGEAIANPYLGPDMATCGNIEKKLAAPAAGSDLSPFVGAYLDVAASLEAGRLDPLAAKKLKAAADLLRGDDLKPVRQAADTLAGAANLNAARAAVHSLSDKLMSRLVASAEVRSIEPDLARKNPRPREAT